MAKHELSGLIQQLLAFAGGIQGERSSLHIDQLIEETRRLLEHTLPKSIRIHTRVDDDCPPVLGDATEISQILMNLCINARDAMSGEGTLTVEAECIRYSQISVLPHPDAHPGTYLQLKISDSGCGMSADVLDRIFDPFFTTKEIGKGTGLGLATVQGIVKGHGGFILVYSEPGHGSSFSIYLPAAPTVDHEDPESKQVSELDSGAGLTVMIVDDELMILQITSAVLEGNGYRVITANDGTSAIRKYSENENQIDAVLLDMMMPGIDGFQTLNSLISENPDATVIACSGLGTAEREQNAIASGAKAFLPKPYSDDQLLNTLARVLQNKRNCR